MMKRITKEDRSAVMACLECALAYNAFAIGDIENFGFDQPFQDVWADVAPDGAYRAVLLRYFDNHIVYAARDDYDKEAVRNTIVRGKRGSTAMLTGKESVVEELAPRLGMSCARRQFLAELRHLAPDAPSLSGIAFEWATPKTFDDVLALQFTIEEFHDIVSASKGLRHNLESGTGRTVLVRRNGKVIATASTAAESSRAAVLIGVCTDHDYRRQGLATACVTKLCRELVDENKIACLFYDNPAAARIYKRLGFRDVGRWAMGMRESGE
jgi:uncharacterized protein